MIDYSICLEACRMQCGKYCASEIELIGHLLMFTPYEDGTYMRVCL